MPEPDAGVTAPPTGADTGRLDKLQQQLDQQARDMAAMRTSQTRPTVTHPQPNGTMSREDVEKEFWKNPLETSATIARMAATEAMNNINASMAPTLIDAARTSARNTDPELFDQYRDEVEAAVAIAPENIRGNANVWINAFRMVKGEHVNDIVAKKTAANASAAVHTGKRTDDGPASPSTRTPAAPAKTALSDDEKSIARKLGLTEDGYRHGKELMEQQDGAGPSMWDKVVTTNSREKRRNARTTAAK